MAERMAWQKFPLVRFSRAKTHYSGTKLYWSHNVPAQPEDSHREFSPRIHSVFEAEIHEDPPRYNFWQSGASFAIDRCTALCFALARQLSMGVCYTVWRCFGHIKEGKHP